MSMISAQIKYCTFARNQKLLFERTISRNLINKILAIHFKLVTEKIKDILFEIKELEKAAVTLHIIYALIWSNKSNQKSWSEIFEKAKLAIKKIDLALVKTSKFSTVIHKLNRFIYFLICLIRRSQYLMIINLIVCLNLKLLNLLAQKTIYCIYFE